MSPGCARRARTCARSPGRGSAGDSFAHSPWTCSCTPSLERRPARALGLGALRPREHDLLAECHLALPAADRRPGSRRPRPRRLDRVQRVDAARRRVVAGVGCALRRVCGALWALGLALTLVSTRSVLWLVGPITGAALGATWAADRVLMLRLSPPEALGELYGIYGMVGRFSAITGPLLWGAIVYFLVGRGAMAYRAAVASLLAMLLGGAAVLAAVEEPRGGENAR